MARRWRVALFFALGLLLASAADARADPILYAVIGGSGALGTVDVQTGAFTQTGTLSGGPEDLARLPGGPLYAELSSHDLVIVDPATAQSTLVGNTGNGIYAVKFRKDGILFGASYTDLYTIDTTTAQAKHVGAFGVPSSTYFDLSFDDQNNLYMAQSSGTLYKVDTTTGAATAVGPIGFAVNAAVFDQGTLYGFTSDSKIITINTSTGVGTLLANVSPAGSMIYGVATTAGAPVRDAGTGDRGGGAVDSGVLPAVDSSAVDARVDLILYAVVGGSGAFGTVDVQTGAFTQTGTLSGGPEDLARLPGGPLYAELSSHDLVIVDPATAQSTLIGNTGNEIYAVKFRKDGVLFGASHTDLYTIDTTTAQAKHVGAFGVPSSAYFDLSFDDQNNLYMTQSSGTLYKVDATTGAATAIGPIGFAVNAVDFDQGTLYGFTSDSKIITINTSTGVGTLLANVSPAGSMIFGVATTVGALVRDAGTGDGRRAVDSPAADAPVATGTDGATGADGVTDAGSKTETGVGPGRDGGTAVDGASGTDGVAPDGRASGGDSAVATGPARDAGNAAEGGSSGNGTVDGATQAPKGSSGCSCRLAEGRTTRMPGFVMLALVVFAGRLRKRGTSK